MSALDLAVRLGIKGIRRVGNSYVVEYESGARPATPLEVRMWDLLCRANL